MPQELFEAVQASLARNRQRRRRPRSPRLPGLLEGLLYCSVCCVRMRHTYTSKGQRRYRYYICPQARERGSAVCPAGSIPASEIEELVWSELAHDARTELGAGGRQSLTTAEQAAQVARTVERIEYDGREGELTIQLVPPAEVTA